MLRNAGQCSQPDESSPFHRSADFITDTNDEPLDRWTILQHLGSPNDSAILEEPRFSRRSPRNDGESLGQNGFGLLASRRPNGGLSLCPMEFLVVTPGAALGTTLKNFHSLRSVTCWNIIVSCLKKTLRVHKSSTFSTKAQQGTVVYESRL